MLFQATRSGGEALVVCLRIWPAVKSVFAAPSKLDIAIGSYKKAVLRMPVWQPTLAWSSMPGSFTDPSLEGIDKVPPWQLPFDVITPDGQSGLAAFCWASSSTLRAIKTRNGRTLINCTIPRNLHTITRLGVTGPKANGRACRQRSHGRGQARTARGGGATGGLYGLATFTAVPHAHSNTT